MGRQQWQWQLRWRHCGARGLAWASRVTLGVHRAPADGRRLCRSRRQRIGHMCMRLRPKQGLRQLPATWLRQARVGMAESETEVMVPMAKCGERQSSGNSGNRARAEAWRGHGRSRADSKVREREPRAERGQGRARSCAGACLLHKPGAAGRATWAARGRGGICRHGTTLSCFVLFRVVPSRHGRHIGPCRYGTVNLFFSPSTACGTLARLWVVSAQARLSKYLC
jgi:hypothetical protein